MSHNAAKKIEREHDHLFRTNQIYRELAALHPTASMDELLESFKWVQGLVEKVIQRTIRDLTCPPPPATLFRTKKDR